MHFGIIKVKSENELEACLKIREKVFIEEKQVPREIENDEYDVIDNRCEHFLIFNDEKPVGTVRMRFIDKNTVKLQRFCFLKEYRKLGLGAKTLDFIEKRYKTLGKSKIIIEAKYEVSPFYEKCGYRAVSDIFYEVNVKHIKMEKEL